MTNIGLTETHKTLSSTHFSSLTDPRRINKGNVKFSLQEIIFLTLSAVVSECNTWELI